MRLKPNQMWTSDFGTTARIDSVSSSHVNYTIVGERIRGDEGPITRLRNISTQRTQHQFRDHYNQLLRPA